MFVLCNEKRGDRGVFVVKENRSNDERMSSVPLSEIAASICYGLYLQE